MKKILTSIFAVVLMSAFCVAGSLSSCKEDGAEKTVTGKVIGSYSNGFFSVLVQVDSKYPIGKTIEYVDTVICLEMPEEGTYRNMIQVQACLPLSEIMNKRISFSYRLFKPGEDSPLFIIGSGIGNGLCGPPDTPTYVITHCQILNN